MKLFAKYVLGKKNVHLDKIERPKKIKALPKVIDSEHLKNIILNIENKKHKAIIALGYSCALRVSEVVNLKRKDIDIKRMLIHIRNSKGRKDRFVKLSPELLNIIIDYGKEYRPKEYLFNGQFSLRYSITSCNKIVKKYIGDDYHFHNLRHSGATTLLENGTDISIIQKILGHNQIKTTMLYTHISKAHLSNVNMPL